MLSKYVFPSVLHSIVYLFLVTSVAEVHISSSMPHDVSLRTPRGTRSKHKLDPSVQDLQKSQLWRDISSHYSALEKPAFDMISQAEDLVCAPDGKMLSFTGSFWPTPDNAELELSGTPSTRICFLDLNTKELKIITRGPNNDRCARWSSDRTRILFLSDRESKGVFQLYILNRESFGEAQLLTFMERATVEYADWSPDSTKILLATVNHDNDSDNSNKAGNNTQWMPVVQSSSQEDQRRKLWVYEVASKQLTRIGAKTCNPWEACWAGNQMVLSISSASPGEESWYYSDVCAINTEKAPEQEICVHRYDHKGDVRQFGVPAATPDGTAVAFVRCLSSDRGIVAGDIHVVRLCDDLDMDHYKTYRVPVGQVDVTDLKFFDNDTLMYIGVSGIGIVAGKVCLDWHGNKLQCSVFEELFKSSEGVAEWFYPKLSPLRGVSDPLFAIVLQSRSRPPAIGIVNKGKFSVLHSFSHAGCDWLRSKVGDSRTISWKSTDGLKIQGLLDLPNDTVTKPYPLILHVHGGPTASWQNCWAGWPGWTLTQHLVSRGYAVLSPNPRGSSGRGQHFAEKVLGDIGGLETQDHLSGITYLVNQGIADHARIGVMGASHGGFMANWLVSQDNRFKACVSIAAVNDWHS